MKKILLLAFCLTCISGTVFAYTANENLNNAMGHAYKAATENKLNEAKDWFQKAIPFAKQAKNWQGLIDAGYGLSTLGYPKEAVDCFNNAEEIIAETKDWRAGVALGYAYASLPDNLNALSKAESIWIQSKAWAKDKNDLFGLIESGRGLMSINKNKDAEESFDLAKELLILAPTENGKKVLSEAYKKLGRDDKAAECAAITVAVISDTPPPGWTPTASETIRSPKTVPIEAQQAMKQSADDQVKSQIEWQQQDDQNKMQERLAKQQMAYDAYRDYMSYYSYPYYGVYGGLIGNCDDYYAFSWGYRPVWGYRTFPEIYNWAAWNMGRYYCGNDGFYFAIGIN